jgi:hypothetical protein
LRDAWTLLVSGETYNTLTANLKPVPSFDHLFATLGRSGFQDNKLGINVGEKNAGVIEIKPFSNLLDHVFQ